jgi:hypothetical protein
VDLLDQEHQPTKNNTTPATSPHQHHHHNNNLIISHHHHRNTTTHSTLLMSKQQGKIHTTSTPSINQTSKTKDHHGYLVKLGTRSSS